MHDARLNWLRQLLRWTEKYTKTDMVYLARGTVYSVVGQGTGLVASLALAIVVSHFIPKESYGMYKYILSMVAFLSIFSLNSIGSAVFQSAAQGFDGALLRAFWVNIRWSAAVFVGALMLSAYYFIMHQNTLAIGILIGGSFSPFLSSANLFGSFLAGKKDFYRVMLYGIFDNVIPILIFIGVILLTANPVVLVATYFITNTAAALYFYHRTVHLYRAQMHVHDEKLVDYSKHLSIMGILTGIANNIDQILIFHFLGGAQLATYNFAIAIPEMIKGPIRNISTMLQPQFVKRTGEEIRSGMNRKLFWMSAGTICITLAYIVAAPTIFYILFPAYTDTIWYSQLYALWILTLSLDPMATYLVARKLTAELYVNSAVGTIFGIASMIAGVLLWGLTGVILARIATRTVVALANYVLYRRAIAREIAAAR